MKMKKNDNILQRIFDRFGHISANFVSKFAKLIINVDSLFRSLTDRIPSNILYLPLVLCILLFYVLLYLVFYIVTSILLFILVNKKDKK